jgi:hypothetical protein
MSFAVASRMDVTRDNIWLDMSTSPKGNRCWVRTGLKSLRENAGTSAAPLALWDVS